MYLMYICMHVYIYVCICIYIHTYIQTYTHMYIYILGGWVREEVDHMCVCVCVCVCVCIGRLGERRGEKQRGAGLTCAHICGRNREERASYVPICGRP